MPSKALANVICSSRAHLNHLPPTFLLPFRQNLSTISTTTTSTDPAPPPGSYIPTSHPPTPSAPLQPDEGTPILKTDLRPRHPQLSKHSTLPQPTRPLSSSLSLLPALAAQTPHYITVHVHARPYLLTEGDHLRLPFHMPNAPIGTILRLNRATVLGSRDFTFRGNPWVGEEFFVCRAVVTGVEQEPERVKVKTKQRQRRTKTVRSRHYFTTVRVVELRVVPEGKEELEVGGDEEGEGHMVDMHLG